MVYPEETDLDSAMSYVDGRMCRTPREREGIRDKDGDDDDSGGGGVWGGGGGDRKRDVVVVLV